MSDPCKTITADELAELDLFKDDSREALEWLAERFVVRCYEPGELFVKAGDPARDFVVVLEGELHYHPYGDVYELLPGQPGGVLPFSRLTTYRNNGVAAKWTRMIAMDRSNLRDLVYHAPCLADKLVGRMIDRVRDGEQRSGLANRLLALGKLSAGLAHELNNPASAVVRSSSRLRELLSIRRQHAIANRGEIAPPEAQKILLQMSDTIADAGLNSRHVDELERVDREEAMSDWLRANNLPTEVASSLTDAGITAEQLTPLVPLISHNAAIHGLHILAADYEETNLTREIEEASLRIADLINAIKSYSYMDHQSSGDVDVEEGLNVTLRMFHHKLKNNFEVKRGFAGNLPKIKANGGELNQIWTNLIDNAIYAMWDSPVKVLEVRTCLETAFIQVEIIDSGAGIPLEAQTRIFDAFFTTKPVGKGTGLGLDIVYRIVRNHHGTVSFKSEPGRTAFQVRLPLAGRQPITKSI
jgi:signal transduction histidine kinase